MVCYDRYEKPPFRSGQKYVETYSSSNAAARNPEERVQLNKLKNLQQLITEAVQTTLKRNKKSKQRRGLTDLE